MANQAQQVMTSVKATMFERNCASPATFWLGLALVVAITFYCQQNVVLNQFYHQGALTFDNGLFSSLIWRNNWLLYYADGISHDQNSSFYRTHISPFLLSPSAISYLLPLSMAQFYAAFIASMFALLAAIMYGLLNILFCVRLSYAALLALGFASSGLIADSLWLPHYEFFIPAFILLFLTCLATGQNKASWIFFSLSLSVREDAGLHIACLLLTIMACRRLTWMALASQRRERLWLPLNGAQLKDLALRARYLEHQRLLRGSHYHSSARILILDNAQHQPCTEDHTLQIVQCALQCIKLLARCHLEPIHVVSRAGKAAGYACHNAPLLEKVSDRGRLSLHTTSTHAVVATHGTAPLAAR